MRVYTLVQSTLFTHKGEKMYSLPFTKWHFPLYNKYALLNWLKIYLYPYLQFLLFNHSMTKTSNTADIRKQVNVKYCMVSMELLLNLNDVLTLLAFKMYTLTDGKKIHVYHLNIFI